MKKGNSIKLKIAVIISIIITIFWLLPYYLCNLLFV